MLTTEHLIVVGAMLETTASFEKQIERCSLLAEQASSQREQEFWVAVSLPLGSDPAGQKRQTYVAKAGAFER